MITLCIGLQGMLFDSVFMELTSRLGTQGYSVRAEPPRLVFCTGDGPLRRVMGDFASLFDIDKVAAAVDEVRITREPCDEFLGVAELARFCGRTPAWASQRKNDRTFPPPHVILSCGPIWRKSDIVAWKVG